MCTFSQDETNDMYIERISKDEHFWNNCISKAHHFFVTGILPELLGKWYTRSNKIYAISFDQPRPSGSTISNEPGPSGSTSRNEPRLTGSTSSNEHTFCYCNGPEEGDMIACDNETCSIEWFHMTCLKIRSIPKGKWFCPDCRKLPQFIKKKKRN